MKQKIDSSDSRIHNQKISDPGKGKHLWAMVAMYQIINPEKILLGGEIHMDRENLVSIEGPGCFKCEEVYSVFTAKQFCQGKI